MRWILYFLVVINVLAFAWFTYRSEPSVGEGSSASTPQSFNFAAKPTLVLKSELSKAELKARDTRVASSRPAASTLGSVSVGTSEAPLVAGEAGEMCLLLGPYPEVVSARSGKNRLARQNVDVEIVEQVKPLQSVHWVYIEPAESRQKAIATLLELQKNKVDSFLVSEPPYENAISLGLFSKEESANNVMAKHLAAGRNVKKVLRERSKSSLWLAVQPADLSKISPEMLDVLASEDFSIKKQEKLCKSIALLKSYQ